jgi:hypothetical protein
MCLSTGALAQEIKETRQYPIIIGILFQNFAMPLRDLESNFSHTGLSVGSEVRLNRRGTLIQNLQVGAYRNREMGNGLFAISQFVFRPTLTKRVFGELKAGLGGLRLAHPSQAWRFEEGKWKQVTGGSFQLLIPFEVGFGLEFSTANQSISPFISYQVVPALFYNDTVPLSVYSNIVIGVRFGSAGGRP